MKYMLIYNEKLICHNLGKNRFFFFIIHPFRFQSNLHTMEQITQRAYNVYILQYIFINIQLQETDKI